MTYEQALADATRALRECFPDRWQAILDTLRTKSPAPFTARARPDGFVLGIHAQHPGGPLERLELFRAEHSVAISADNVMPFDWMTDEIFGACNLISPEKFMLVERVNGIEVARFPLGAFLGISAFVRVYDQHRTYGLELCPIVPGDVEPFEISLAISGRHGRPELRDFHTASSRPFTLGRIARHLDRARRRMERAAERARREADLAGVRADG